MQREHKEFIHDTVNLAINLSPISWVLSLSHYLHKWAYKKKGVHRVNKRIRGLRGPRRRNRPITMQELEQLMK